MGTPLNCLITGLTYTILAAGTHAQTAGNLRSPPWTPAEPLRSPLFGVAIPQGYRQWELVAVSYEAAFDEFRGILGNETAIQAYRDGKLPFPDGTMFAKLAWKRVPSTEFAGAFVPGAPTTVQIMVKNSGQYADTGGWGFGRFIDGRPVDKMQHQTCFACHRLNVKDHDLVFTRFAP